MPGADAVRLTGIDHVVDWIELQAFLAARAVSSPPIYYARDGLASFEEMPANLVSPRLPRRHSGSRSSWKSGLPLRRKTSATL